MAVKKARLPIYGPAKYAALNLLLARWLRGFARPSPYCYVTLGGSELRDVASLAFIDDSLLRESVSYEMNPEVFALAAERATQLRRDAIDVAVQNESLFEYERTNSLPHLFYLDFTHHVRSNLVGDFATLLREETIRAGDGIFITSYNSRLAGWKQILDKHKEYFKSLKIVNTDEEKKNCYTRHHPSFVLYDALLSTQRTGRLALTCFGSVLYRADRSSTMGLYGYTLEDGKTDFRNLILGPHNRYFAIKGHDVYRMTALLDGRF